MAAPSGTVWGNTVTGSKSSRQGCIGIYISTSSTATTVTHYIEVWFWTKYSINDSSNSYYYDADAYSASTYRGSVSVNHTVSSGDGWSTSNQTRLGSYTYTYNRATSTYYRGYAAKFTGIDSLGSSNAMTAYVSGSIPPLASYTVSYNANGGSGAPSSQTKWHGSTLTLSSASPSRTGYNFLGWATSSGGGVSYYPGSSYTANSSITLYAVWQAHTYTVSYNANGGSGAPGSQTKTYDVALTLSSTSPTRVNYNFLGWATSSGGGVSYYPGSSYTANSSITLYAVWSLAYRKPSIWGMSAERCDSSGNISDTGTNVYVKANWSTDRAVTSIAIRWSPTSSIAWQTTYISASGTSGYISQKIGSDSFDGDSSYIVEILISDGTGSSTESTTIPSFAYTMDFYNEGKGVAFGKAAEHPDLLEVEFKSQMNKELRLGKYVNDQQLVSGGIKIHDLRNVTPRPGMFGDYMMNAYFYNANGRWNSILSMSGWTAENSVYATHELAFNACHEDTQIHGLYHRTGTGSSFGPWKTILDSENYINYVMTPSGKVISSLPGDLYSYVWGNGESIHTDILPWSKGIFLAQGGGDAAIMSVDAEGDLSWGFRNSGTWTAVRSTKSKILWSGCWFMHSEQTATLSRPVSEMSLGIILIFSAYENDAQSNNGFNTFFVSKWDILNMNGAGHNFLLSGWQTTYMGCKYIYISNTKLTGATNNGSVVTAAETNNVKFKNNGFVLRYVIGI